MYVTRKHISASLGIKGTVLQCFLSCTNNGDFRQRRFSRGGTVYSVYELEKAVRWLRLHTFLFDAEAEARLRVSAFEVPD